MPNKVFKWMFTGTEIRHGKKPKAKKYTVLICTKEGEVTDTVQADLKRHAELVAKNFPITNIVYRGKTIAVYIDGQKQKKINENKNYT